MRKEWNENDIDSRALAFEIVDSSLAVLLSCCCLPALDILDIPSMTPFD